MRVLAVVSDTDVARGGRRTDDRTCRFVDRLVGQGPVDVVLVHAPDASAERRRRARRALLPERLERLLEVSGAPLARTGQVRDVHLHRTNRAEMASRRSPASLAMGAFVATSPGAIDLVWCADIASLARATWLGRTLPTAVDVDISEDLTSARARRSARSWARGAYLVTVADAEVRDRLAVPGSSVVTLDGADGDHGGDGAAWIESLRSVVDRARGYQPVRTS